MHCRFAILIGFVILPDTYRASPEHRPRFADKMYRWPDHPHGHNHGHHHNRPEYLPLTDSTGVQVSQENAITDSAEPQIQFLVQNESTLNHAYMVEES